MGESISFYLIFIWYILLPAHLEQEKTGKNSSASHLFLSRRRLLTLRFCTDLHVQPQRLQSHSDQQKGMSEGHRLLELWKSRFRGWSDARGHGCPKRPQKVQHPSAQNLLQQARVINSWHFSSPADTGKQNFPQHLGDTPCRLSQIGFFQADKEARNLI